MTNLDHLIKKHRELDLEIARIQSGPRAELLDDNELAHLHLLKKRKLILKDKIGALQKVHAEHSVVA